MNWTRINNSTKLAKWYHWLWILLGSAAVALLLTLAGCATAPATTTIHGIPNFSEVTTYGVYRGGQPTVEGWQYLKSLGVTNVVKLNEISEGSDQPAIDLGMTVNYYPINLLNQALIQPHRFDVFKAVSEITPNTYVHCEHGQDRTGLIIGIYRVKYENVKVATAYEEMLAHGFHTELRGLDDFWTDNIK